MQENLFKDIKEMIFKVIKSRLFLLVLLFAAFFAVLIQRLFTLQIINGESYLENFTLKIKKETKIAGTRGNIYDRDGELLAKNELAYEVTIEDNGTYANNAEKNLQLNKTIHDLINVIESNGDKIINDFRVIIDDSGEFQFSAEGTTLKRFIADVYGKSSANDLSNEQLNSTAEDIFNYLRGKKVYGIADTYTNEEALKIMTVRFSMSANSYQKYLPTTVATGVSDETLAVVMENLNNLQGVSIAENTVRKYVDSEYFSHIIGYTGKISEDEYTELSKESEAYDLTDVIGKAGIEQYMELKLQGVKGSETVYVDNLGRVVDTLEKTESSAGNDVYLTLDKDLQEAVYKIIEQKLAGILISKIRNVKTYTPSENASSKDIIIPIDNVYYALINNNVININNFNSDTASALEKQVYNSFLNKQKSVLSELEYQLTMTNPSSYETLDDEMKVYMSYVASMLSSNNVLLTNEVDVDDDVYLAWKDETISLKEYLNHAIANNWIDITKLDVKSQYSNSDEIYLALISYVKEELTGDTDFTKKLYKYMIADNSLTGRDVCQLLFEQNILQDNDEEMAKLSSGTISPYNFMIDKITNLEITPAQLALDPCSGSAVVTDVNTGEVLAMVTYPSYDNNKLANSIDADYYSQLLNDLSLPLINRATQQKTAPGSTFKMVTAVAALEEGIISPNDTVQCLGLYDKISPVARCWIYPSSHGSLNVSEAIRHSCNYFFYEMAYRLGIDETGAYNSELGLSKLKKYAEMLGLGITSGVEITESMPEISTTDAVRSAIGQGNNSYTNVQLARYVSAVANSGTVYNLSVLDKVTDSEGNLLEDYGATVLNNIQISQSTWDAVHQGMRGVVEYGSTFQGMTLNVAGKTGTAEENKKRPNHALFVGYAPYENPEIAISVQMANGYTSANAAEITRDIINYHFGLQTSDEVLNGTAATPDSIMAGD